MDFEAQSALAGGISASQDFVPHPTVTIRNTVVTGNRVTTVNADPNSTPAGYAGGIGAFSPSLLERVGDR